MLYSYCRKELMYKKITYKGYLMVLGIMTIVSVISIVSGWSLREYSQWDTEDRLVLLHGEVDEFTEEKLVDLLRELNVKFPYIVLAQAKVESGNFSSRIFRENHNLFGMKRARVRVNTALGTQHGHAYYDSWRSSVFDYAFYQCRYLSSISSESEYFQYLSQSYAEDESYVLKLKDMIERENLKSKF